VASDHSPCPVEMKPSAGLKIDICIEDNSALNSDIPGLGKLPVPDRSPNIFPFFI